MSYEPRSLEFVAPLLGIAEKAYRALFLKIPELPEYSEDQKLKFTSRVYTTGDFLNPRNETAGYEFSLDECTGYIGEGRISPLHETRTGRNVILLERIFHTSRLEEVALMYIAAALVKKECIKFNDYPEPKFSTYSAAGKEVGVLVKFDASDKHAHQSAYEIVRMAHALEKAIRHAQAF